jgi:K+-sensing histidine kinase KdpD
VQDTGIGLTEAQRGRLFNPFTQVHEGHVRAGGTGLGLYIARGIAQQHGGTLSVASAGPGAGSVFTVRLPVAGPPAPSGAAPVSDPVPAPGPRPGAGPRRAGPPPGARREGP